METKRPSRRGAAASMTESAAVRLYQQWAEAARLVLPSDQLLAHAVRMGTFFSWNSESQVNGNRLQEYAESLTKKSRGAAKDSISTFVLVFSSLGARSPALKVKVGRHSPRRRTHEPVNESQYRHVLEVFGKQGKDRDNMLLILLMWHCGVAMVDACRLQWEDVDLSTGFISANRAKTATGFRVPIDTDGPLYLLLKEMRGGKPRTGAISDRNRLRYLTARSALCRSIAAACRSAGLPKFSAAHSFRRGFITRLAQAGTPEVIIAKLSGHSNTQSLHRYFLPSNVDLRMALAGINHGVSDYTPAVVDDPRLSI